MRPKAITKKQRDVLFGRTPELTKIDVPYNFRPRKYQLRTCAKFDQGVKRFINIWHRRAGKDKTWINLTAKAMLERVGSYYYFLPTYAQGKKIIWDGMDAQGFPFLGHFPQQLVESINNTEMKLRFWNGSLFQVCGSDNIDSIMGTNPVGCVFSEYALQDPRGWDFIRPILRENGGWAAFVYTPRGKNHGYRVWETNRDNPEWFCEVLTIEDTKTLNKSDIDEERKSGMPEELVQQEYYCSFQAGMVGSYYTQNLNQAEEEGRITDVPYDEALPVDTYWDIGIGDATSIWFSQDVPGGFTHFIDYYETTGEGLPYFARLLKDRGPEGRKYLYRDFVVPHDMKARDWSIGKTREQMGRELGMRFKVLPRHSVDDGINAVRAIFSKCRFDRTKCAQGLDALASYRKEYDDKRQEFKNSPYHDWSSHGADAFRTFAMGHRRAPLQPQPKERYKMRYEPHRTENWKTL